MKSCDIMQCTKYLIFIYQTLNKKSFITTKLIYKAIFLYHAPIKHQLLSTPVAILHINLVLAVTDWLNSTYSTNLRKETTELKGLMLRSHQGCDQSAITSFNETDCRLPETFAFFSCYFFTYQPLIMSQYSHSDQSPTNHRAIVTSVKPQSGKNSKNCVF